MKKAIYYFTGTGNSLSIAKNLAQRIEGELVPIAALREQEAISVTADIMGIVFPVYDFNPPNIVLQFIRKLAALEAKYVFAVGTYGFLALKAMKTVENEIAERRGRLSGGFLIEMPNNGIAQEQHNTAREQTLFGQCEEKCARIASYVDAGSEGEIETSNMLVNFFLSGLLIKTLPRVVPLLLHVLKNGWDSLSFVTDDSCNGCGVCVRVCPADNIRMVGDRPVWGEYCELCFACFNWCPRKVVQAGTFTIGKPRYQHPETKISEIVSQKQIS